MAIFDPGFRVNGFFRVFGDFGPKWSILPTRQIPPADRWERWGESGGLVKSTTGPKMSENLPKFPCRLYSHAGGLHNPEGQVSAVASPYWWTDGRTVDGWMPPNMAKNRPKMGASAPSFGDTNIS